MKTPKIDELTKKLLKKRNHPNYDIVRKLAYYVHKNYCKHELPIDLSFMYNFKNLKIKTYSWFAKLNNISIEETITLLNSDSGCCYYMVNEDKYLILYNDLIENPCHNRWTLAHEFGHYLLKHNEICNMAIIGRNAININEYKIYEKEANAFARELLAPLYVLCCIYDKVTVTRIMDMCELSFEAAKNIIKFAKNGKFMGISYFNETNTTDLFKDFIYNHKHLNSCENCKYTFISESAKFCPICGSNKLIKGDLKEKMKYKCDYTLDLNGKSNICPVCHNEELSDGEFCKICGTYIVNKCTNFIEDEWGNKIHGCGKLADANARYCIYCGSETTFFKNGILKSWNDPILNYNITELELEKYWKNFISHLKVDGKFILYTNLLYSNPIIINENTIAINFPNRHFRFLLFCCFKKR